MPARPDIPADPFAGELFRSLAAEGRLRLDPGQADAAIESLERTLAEVRTRLRLLQRRREASPGEAGELSDQTVDAIFADQLAPGRLELATVEIPKYVEALRLARRQQP
ncbi:hypothetical protein KOI35_32260 [Actinoplanes bogorensis]|uniref:Uncharacterized protein n=1 Tax=Paractinoplanes bogorensis TaxID=1610840 RepID=A0ABS5YYN1_9ACTN|nr:hypothetical protein [Actinoplanes bogorensis]MBU2668196.1 hypothetical protein [Actinoplanes bogorensis]